MIPVRKISHATYETPDLDRQVEYYTEILGLTLTGKDKDVAYLANTIDHHAVVLRKGTEAKCVHLGFQLGPEDDLDAFEKQTKEHGIKTSATRIPSPLLPINCRSRIPRAPSWRCSSAVISPNRNFRIKASFPTSLGTSLSHHRRSEGHQFYCDVLGFRVSDWMADFFSFLRCGPRSPHAEFHEHWLEPAFSHRLRAARLVTSAEAPATISA